MKEKGQVVLIIILIMATALGVGLSVVQRSLSDIQSSARVEESQRAFSAAEAGIERALRTQSADTVDVGQGRAVVSVTPSLPEANQALEYPPQSKEEIAHVWLVNPNDLNDSVYSGNIEIYWGNSQRPLSDQDLPAVEITVVYLSTGGTYKAKKFFFDYNAASRNNGFDASVEINPGPINTSMGQSRSFKFKKIADIGLAGIPDRQKNILLRARLLYTLASDNFAVLPISGSLPKQARVLTSVGTSGETQRKVQLFKLDKVVPFYFDYALFSAGSIEK